MNPAVWMRAACSVNSLFSYVRRCRNRHRCVCTCARAHAPSSSSVPPGGPGSQDAPTVMSAASCPIQDEPLRSCGAGEMRKPLRKGRATRTRGPTGRCGMSAPDDAPCGRTELVHVHSSRILSRRRNVRKGSSTVKLWSLKVTSVMNHNEEAHYEVHPCCVKRKLERIWQFLSVMLGSYN